jgi:hypothetical protein
LHLILIESFPLNNNGKIDRKQLIRPTMADMLSSAATHSNPFIAPVTEFQVLVATAYSQVLNIINPNEISINRDLSSMGRGNIHIIKPIRLHIPAV